MGDQQSMFLFLVAFYALECLMWLPRSSTAFCALFSRHYRRLSPGELLGNHRGAMVIRPLLPFGSVFQVMPLPAVLMSDGVAITGIDLVNPGEIVPSTREFIAWNDISKIVAEGKSVVINGERRWSAPSQTIALSMAAELDAFRVMPREQRAQEIESRTRKRFDLSAIRERQEQAHKLSRVLGILGLVLFLYVNCLLLPSAMFISFSGIWPWIIGVALLQTSLITFLFWRAHKQLYPDSGDERFTAGLTMLLFAPAAMRAKDLITAPALSHFHPLALARVLMHPEAAKRYAKDLLREHRWAPPAPTNKAKIEAISEGRSQLESAVEDFCRAQGWQIEELLQPPARTDPDSQSYCPRCLSEYLKESGACGHCGQVPLQPFETAGPEVLAASSR